MNSKKVRYEIYPVYYREGYGYQQDNPEGTDGVPRYFVLYEEDIEFGGEGAEVINFSNSSELYEKVEEIANFLNASD